MARCAVRRNLGKRLRTPQRGVPANERFGIIIRGQQVTERAWDCQLAGVADALQIGTRMHPSFATRANLDLLEQNYQRWQENPESLDPSWLAFFDGFELGDLQLRNGAAVAGAAPIAGAADQPLQTRVDGLVYAYRTLGHTIARIDPLAEKRPSNPLLSLRELGFSE